MKKYFGILLIVCSFVFGVANAQRYNQESSKMIMLDGKPVMSGRQGTEVWGLFNYGGELFLCYASVSDYTPNSFSYECRDEKQ